MATKRQAPDDRESRQQPWKRHKPNDPSSSRPNHGKKSFKKAHPVNELKSTIRSVRRLLDRENLPANVRVEKERELQTAQRELARAQKAKLRSDIIGKWHKVRFFERQKAERRLKKARRELEKVESEDGEDEEVEKLRKEVQDREVDVNYALNFPLDVDYVPLWPTRRKGGDEEGVKEGEKKEGEEERQGDAAMWRLVEECTRKGNLADLREGRLTGLQAADDAVEETSSVKVSAPMSSKAKKKQAAESKPQRKTRKDEEEDEESDNESGGGFFE